MNRIQKGDTVIVTTGKSKGHVGVVLKVLGSKVTVEGANFVSKCVKPNPHIGEKGGIIKREGSIDSSNVALYNPITKKADKVGFKYLDKNSDDKSTKKTKVRYFKSNNELVTSV